MKIPLLSRRVQHKRFNFEPRHYDPVKEDIKNRTARISAEIRQERSTDHSENIRAAFKSAEKRERSISFTQLFIMFLLLGAVLGWMYYGNTAIYIFLAIFLLFIYLKSRAKSTGKNP